MKTADLVDLHDDEVTVCDLPFRRFGRIRAFLGEAATVKCHEDNSLLRSFLQEPGMGRVMVVDAGGSTRCAILGDQLAEIMRRSGWAGIVINGAIRDSAEIDRMDVGVAALGTSPKKSSKHGAGQRQIAVHIGGARLAPGDWVYCDPDGILVSQRKLV